MHKKEIKRGRAVEGLTYRNGIVQASQFGKLIIGYTVLRARAEHQRADGVCTSTWKVHKTAACLPGVPTAGASATAAPGAGLRRWEQHISISTPASSGRPDVRHCCRNPPLRSQLSAELSRLGCKVPAQPSSRPSIALSFSAQVVQALWWPE